jgi:hypothetical protein
MVLVSRSHHHRWAFIKAFVQVQRFEASNKRCPLQVCLRFGGSQRLLWPPVATGPPPGEVPLQPLLEVLKPGNLVGLFAAVLLEQRVLLRVRLCCCVSWPVL